MASSMTLTASFFGGAVAAKPAKATTRRGPLAVTPVMASMDLEKVVTESTNTRRGLVLAAVAATAASSVVKVAMADDANSTSLGGWRPVPDPSSPEILQIAIFAVSEFNKQNNASLVFESVIKAETQVVNGVNYRLLIGARDSLTGRSNQYLATVYVKAVPTTVELTSFFAILR